jgi:pyruvate/2-oxoglutarate dehydrogenase complex dihydrolipoamide dehydrogenase (E3) component
MTEKFDVIWIGTGQATGTVVPRLVKAGKSVAIAEGGKVGGSCVNYGCTPTKTLVASARAAHMAHRGPDFGVQTTEITIDFQNVMERQKKMRKEGSQGLEDWLQGLDGVTLLPNFALFEDAHTLRVGGKLIQGETIVINAGGRPRRLPLEGLESVNWLNNKRLLDIEQLPNHLMIVGGGYISLEFAQIFRRLGSQVTIIEAGPQLMRREDQDIADTVQQILENEGIRIILNADVKQVEQLSGEKIKLVYSKDNGEISTQGSHLLLAVGRVPNSDTLNLDAAGVAVDERGYIEVNEVMQTSQSHIFAVGDINGEGAFTHTSVNDGEIFWDHFAGEEDRLLSDRIPTYALFTDPPLGRVGLSEEQAQQSGRNIWMATRPMSQISRAREKDETSGLIKILVDMDTEKIVGAAVLGVGGDETINVFTPFMYTGESYKLFRRTVLTHPTVAELLPWILDDLQPLSKH